MQGRRRFGLLGSRVIASKSTHRVELAALAEPLIRGLEHLLALFTVIGRAFKRRLRSSQHVHAVHVGPLDDLLQRAYDLLGGHLFVKYYRRAVVVNFQT